MPDYVGWSVREIGGVHTDEIRGGGLTKITPTG